MITDRTEADVTAVATLKAKFSVEDAVGTYIEISNLGSGKYFVFKGTQSELNSYMAGLKGAWNYTDLNRIGNAIRSVVNSLNALGIFATVTAKNDWTVNDIPTSSQANALLTDLTTIKNLCAVARTVPDTLNRLDYVTANNIEAIVLDAYLYVYTLNSSYNHCGSTICGAGGIFS